MRAIAIHPWISEIQAERKVLYFTMGLMGFASLCFAPRINLQPTLFTTFAIVAAALAFWFSILLRQSLSGRRSLDVFVNLVPAHYVQSCLQTSIYVYWSFYWSWIGHAALLILGQVIFAYLFDALLSWSRGKPWRIGFGPIPITLSTNLFLCFRDEWFYFQFLVIALAYLAKEFITWERNGQRTHIFNPSAFPLFVFSIVLLAAGATELTWAQEIAVQLNNPPHIYLWIFAVGLVVQGLFHVTLVTLGAGLALFLANLSFTALTGTYWFLDAGIPIAVFLGMHLLVTDPATSPRNNAGRFVFGFLYGISVFAIYGLLEHWGQPSYFDKLLCVPVLNLLVMLLERLGSSRTVMSAAPASGALTVESTWSQGAQNRLAMVLWIGLFSLMYALRVVGPDHPGQSNSFWQQACADGRPTGCDRLERIYQNNCAAGNIRHCELLAGLQREDAGELAMRNLLRTESMACEYGSAAGCGEVGRMLSADRVAELESDCSSGDGLSCQILGAGELKGLGVSQDVDSAREHFRKACDRRMALGCALTGDLYFHGVSVERDVDIALGYYRRACMQGYAFACDTLKRLYQTGDIIPASLPLSRWYRSKVCALAGGSACER